MGQFNQGSFATHTHLKKLTTMNCNPCPVQASDVCWQDSDACSSVSVCTVDEKCGPCPVDCPPKGFRDKVADFFKRSRSCSPCGNKDANAPQMKTCYRKEYYTAKVPVTKIIRVPEEIQVTRRRVIRQKVPTTKTKWVKQVVPCEKTVKRTVKVPCTKTKMRSKTITSWKTVTKSRQVPYTVCETPCPPPAATVYAPRQRCPPQCPPGYQQYVPSQYVH